MEGIISAPKQVHALLDLVAQMLYDWLVMVRFTQLVRSLKGDGLPNQETNIGVGDS